MPINSIIIRPQVKLISTSNRTNCIINTPTLENDEEAELSRIARKIDWHIIPVIMLIYLLNFLDRVNIGYARLYHLENDLNLSQTQYSWTLSIFFIGYIIFEIPSNLMLKKAKPSRWIARIMISWGVISASFAAVRNFPGMVTCRFFLGVAEAGLFPGIMFYLSFWYTRKQQAIRLSMFFSASSMSAIVSGPLAFAIGKMNGLGGLKAWQWIFIVEGIPSIVFGFAVFWLLPNSPCDVKWLTPQEQMVLLKRMAHDQIDPGNDKIEWKQIREAFTDYKIYLYMMLHFSVAVPMYCMAQLLPTIIKSMGFNESQAMLLTIPPYVTSTALSILLAWRSDQKQERCFHFLSPMTISVAGYTMLCFVNKQIAQYIACYFAVVGVISSVPLELAWFNNNMVGNTKSATAPAMVVSFANVGGFLSGQMYRNTEAPRYLRSNMICLVCLLSVVIMSFTLRFCLKRENEKLDELKSRELEKQTNSGFKFNNFRYTL